MNQKARDQAYIRYMQEVGTPLRNGQPQQFTTPGDWDYDPALMNTYKVQEAINRMPTDWQRFMKQARPSTNIEPRAMTQEDANKIPYDRQATYADPPFYDPRANRRLIDKSPSIFDPMVQALYRPPPVTRAMGREPVSAPLREIQDDLLQTIRRALEMSPPTVP